MGRSRLPLILVLAFAAGCSTTQPVVDPEETPLVVYHQPDSPESVVVETYKGAGGALLAYTHFRSVGERAIVYLHGIESHGGWFHGAADRLRSRGYDVFCLDRRGSGLNRESRGFVSGHVDHRATLIEDVHRFIAAVRPRFTRLYLAGLSWGGKQAMGHALAHPDDCDGLILITPGLRSRIDMGFVSKIGILISSVVSPRHQVSLPLEAEMFTHTPRFLDLMGRDPLRLHAASARFLTESTALEKDIDKTMPNNRLPVLLFLAGQDCIIDNDGVVSLLQRGSQHRTTVLLYPDQTHSIQFDAPDRLVEDMDRWIGGLEGRTPLWP